MRRIILPDFLLIVESFTQIPAEMLQRGYCNTNLAESALAAPFAGFGDYERYPLMYEKAAIYCSRIVTNHSLTDGNKRAGYLTMRMFLNLNDLPWEHGRDGEEETIRAVECLAAGTIPEEHFVNWVGHRVHDLRDIA